MRMGVCGRLKLRQCVRGRAISSGGDRVHDATVLLVFAKGEPTLCNPVASSSNEKRKKSCATARNPARRPLVLTTLTYPRV